MDKKNYIIIGMAVALLITITWEPIESAIPPTPAFRNIGTNDTDVSTGGWVNATGYASDLYIISDGSILIEPMNYTDSAE